MIPGRSLNVQQKKDIGKRAYQDKYGIIKRNNPKEGKKEEKNQTNSKSKIQKQIFLTINGSLTVLCALDFLCKDWEGVIKLTIRTLFSITENFGIRATKIKKGNKKFHCPYVKILKE